MKKLGLYSGLVAVLLIAAGAYAVAGSGSEGTNVPAVTLIGYLEAPSISTNAVGSFEATIDDAERRIRYTLSYSGLEGTVTQAHIHFGQQHTVGAIVAWLCEGTARPPVPELSPVTPECPQSGTVSGTIGPAQILDPPGQDVPPFTFAELLRAIRAGATYANVHSAVFPPGEIRGHGESD